MKLAGLEPEWKEFDGARFKLKPLTAPERLECLSYSDINTVHLMFDKACRYAIVDWEQVEDEKGPVQFDRKLVSNLPDATWGAIARHVLHINTLGESDQKN